MVFYNHIIILFTFFFFILYLNYNGNSYSQPEDDTLIASLIDKGNSLRNEGRNEEAIQYFNKVLEIYPYDFRVLILNDIVNLYTYGKI
jgi:tetratricopeptide (TPR) repeat protein